VADLHDARVAPGLFEEDVRELRGLARDLEVDRLHESVRVLPLPGLGEPRHRAPEGGDGSRLVVAVLAAETRGGDEEGALRDHPFLEGAHRRVEELHPHAERLPPSLEAEGPKLALGVESGQPVDTLDRLLRRPLLDLTQERLRGRRVLETQHVAPQLLETADEGRSHSAAIAHDEHAAFWSQGDAGGLAQREGRAHDGHHHAPRHAVGGGEVGEAGDDGAGRRY
jgi:hypothetical protein